MIKVKVTVPAASTNLGPGLDCLGLALALHNVVELNVRPDSALSVATQAEGSDRLPANFRHPVVTAASRLFQTVERAPAGLNVAVTNRIPWESGLGSRAAMIVGGLVAANNLLGNPIGREELIGLACELDGRPAGVVTAMLGGLTAVAGRGADLVYRSLQVAPLHVVIAVPEAEPERSAGSVVLFDPVPLQDAVFNLSHAVLLVDALRTGDFDLLEKAMQDRLHLACRAQRLAGYDQAAAAARAEGARAVTLSGNGPALLAFSLYNHRKIASAVEAAFAGAGVLTRTWVAPVDRQGVVVNVAETPG